ncbi:MAG: YabP/YqfC family sporulation protein [Lachnospiraceae bacterium]|nr:YabP/YqfC family sporulation protein [Lachnospiraceae bacterium]
MKKNKHPIIKDQMVEALELPKDLVYHAAIVTITGKQELTLENYKGILEYQTDHISVQTKNCRVTISGKNLRIPYYTNEEMKITGLIQKILYE